MTQDIAVIPILALLPLLAPPGARAIAQAEQASGHAAMSLIESLPGWGVTLVTLGAVVATVAGGHYLIRPLYRYVHAARLREIHTAFALMIVVSIASLMLMVGLSPALGTFLAGVVLASSEFRHELESDVAPFKGLLLGLFFITVGAGIDFGVLLDRPLTILGMTAALMLTKGIVLFFLALVFGMRGRNKWLFTLGLAQAANSALSLCPSRWRSSPSAPTWRRRCFWSSPMSMLLTPLLLHPA